MTMSDLQGYLKTVSLLKCDFADSYAVVKEISIDIVCRVVPLRQLSFLCLSVRQFTSE